MTESGQQPTLRRVPRQADLRLDDDFLDLPLTAGGGREEEPTPSPPPRRRSRPWLAPLLILLIAAAAGGWYLSLSPPSAELSAESLDFDDVRLGTESGELAVEVRNRGEKNLSVAGASITVEGLNEFTVTTDECSGREVRPGETCNLKLRFTPESRGARQARLEIASNAIDGTVSLPLLGNAVEPELSFDPARLDFGEQLVGSTGTTSRLWLTNGGSAPLALGKVELEGLAAADFVSGTDACSDVTLAPGKRCGVEYRFVPTVEGLRRAQVTIRSDARPLETSPWLVGIGLPREPLLRLEPERLEFGSWLVGAESAPQTVTIHNEGDGPLVLGRLRTSLAELSSVDGDEERAVGFAVVTDGCSGGTVVPGANCQIEIAFRPLREGDARAFFEIEHSARQGRHALPVFGTGTAPRASVDPSRLSFGEVPVAIQSQPRVLRVVNSGSGPLRISRIALEGADRRAFEPPASSCISATVEPGTGCSVEIRFRPYRDGPHRAELVVSHSAGDGIHRLPVNGIGVSAKLTVEPERLDLGEVRVTSEGRQSLVLRNRGRAAVEIQALGLRGTYASDFELRDDRCSESVLPPGGSCTASVRFAPRSVGTRNAVVEIVHRVEGPRQVPVTATALEPPKPELRLSLTAFDFGPRRLGESSATYTLRIENPGSGRLALDGLRITGAHPGDFHLGGGSCTATDSVAPGGDCTVELYFRPTAPGPRLAELVLRHNADSGIARITLDGVGVEALTP